MSKATARQQSHPLLAEQLQATKAGFMAQLPDDTRMVVADAFEQLLNSRIGMRAISRGDYAPDFHLPRIQGGELSLSDALETGHVVLSFYRGGWCPFCNLELGALNARMTEIRAYGANVVAVAPELPEPGSGTVAELGLGFPLLHDAHNRVARQYGLVMSVPVVLRPLYRQWGFDLPTRNGDDSWELPLPATYVIDREGTVRAAFVEKDYTQRMEPENIIAVLQSLAR